MNEYYWSALERAIAEIIAQFREAPDLWWRQADLHAALYRALRGCDLLAERYATRDGRAAQLLHLAEPARFAYEGDLTPPAPLTAPNARHVEGGGQRPSPPAPLPEGEGGASGSLCPRERAGARVCYDLAILNPAFVRTQKLAALTGADAGALDALRRLPPAERPTPLLAALNARLVDDLTPQTLQALEAPFYGLARSEPDALRAYYLILCRHWDVDAHARRAVEALLQWQTAAPQVNIALAQSYSDDVGRVFVGRYFGLWSYTAPMVI